MKMIVGLGNVGSQYQETRHNTGFMVVDEFASKNNIHFTTQKMEAKIGTGMINGEKVMLVKPLTFMNESGRAVGPLMEYYKLDLSDLIVVYDDMDLPVGKIRLRNHGSAGGHNGIKSLIAHLKTDKFNRIRVGTDHPTQQSVVDYVLGQFTDSQKPMLLHAMNQSVAALNSFVDENDFQQLENRFN